MGNPNDHLLSKFEKGSFEEVQTILQTGFDANTRGKYGWTPLMVASNKNTHLEVIELLLNKGAEINAFCTKHKQSALMVACRNNDNPEIINLLLSKGADVAHSDDLGETALTYAKERGNDHIIQLIKNAGGK